MPLPWLIGVAAVAVGSAVVAALTSDDNTSSNTDEEERRRRIERENQERQRIAEQQRKEREIRERKDNFIQNFNLSLQNLYQDIQDTLPKYVRVSGQIKNQINLTSSGSNLAVLVSRANSLDFGFDENYFLTRVFRDVSFFKNISSLNIRRNSEMDEVLAEINLLQDELKVMEEMMNKLA